MEFKNTQEMELLFNQISRQVVNDISKQMSIKMQNEIENQDIGTSNSEFYKPTGEFKEAWIEDKPQKINNNTYESTMYYEPKMIKTKDPDNFIHGSSVKGWEDYPIEEALPYVIFETGSPAIWGENKSTSPRNAWQPFVSNMDNNFNLILQQAFNKQGVKLVGR